MTDEKNATPEGVGADPWVAGLEHLRASYRDPVSPPPASPDVAKLREALEAARKARRAWELAMMADDYEAARKHSDELDAALAETETKEGEHR